MFYQALGRVVWKFGVAFVRRRYSRQLRALAALTVVSILLGGYLATRTVKEG
jgi:heme A synthase